MIDVNNIQKYPDHTEQIERLEQKDGVDKILPQHIGGEKEGRFCTAFLVLQQSSAKIFSLLEEEGEYEFKPLYNFSLENEYHSYGEIWNRDIIFQWEDREVIDVMQKKMKAYVRRFTLGEKYTLEQIDRLVEEGEWTDDREDPPECKCKNQPKNEEQLNQLDLTIISCAKCNSPYRLSIGGTSQTLYRTSFELDWIEGDWGKGCKPIERDCLRFYEVESDGETTTADATLHGLTRESQIEYPNFGYYRGDHQKGLLIGNPEIGSEGEIVGYLLWNQPGQVDRPCLQQVYVRPKYRDEEYGGRLLNMWHEEVVEESRYFAIDVSESGMDFLRNHNHVTEDRDCPAIPAELWGSWDTEGVDVSKTAAADVMRRQGY